MNKWQTQSLENVCDFQNGFAFKSSTFRKSGIPLLRISNIQNGVIDDSSNVFIDPKDYDQDLSSYIVNQEDLVIAMSGATTGKIGIVKNPVTYYLNQRVGKFIPKSNLLKKYLMYFLLTKVRENLDISAGSAQPNLSTTQIKNIKIPVPPMKDQQRLVDKIEELFSVIDKQCQIFKQSKQDIKNLKQTFLSNAFNGELTKDQIFNYSDLKDIEQKLLKSRIKLWQSTKKENYKNSSKPRDNVKVKNDWLTFSLEDFGLIETGATPLRSNQSYWKNGSIPWVTSSVVNKKKVLASDEYITELALNETNAKKFPPETLLIAMYGEGQTRGKVTELSISATTNQALAAVILSEEAKKHKDYLLLYLLKNYDDIRRLSSGGVQPNLNLKIIKETPIPFPSSEEQKVIVDTLTQSLSVCDYVSKQIDSLLIKANLVKQSILKQAFEGKLG